MKRQFLQLIILTTCLALAIQFFFEPVVSAALQVNIDRVTFTPHRQPWINIFVSVFDQEDLAVKGLDEKRFTIKEDGNVYSGPIEVEPFVTSERRLAYIIVLETQEKLATSMTLVCQGLQSFIKEMGFRYPGAILNYTGYPEVVIKPTRNANLLIKKINELKPVKGLPRLYDGLLTAVKELNGYTGQSEFKADRLAIILLTDGQDQGSMFSLAADETKMLQSNISLFVIAYGKKERRSLSNLARITKETGGGYYFAHSPDLISPLLAAVAGRLKYQYILTYPANNFTPDGRSHKVSVDIETADDHGQGIHKFIMPELKTERIEILTTGILIGAALLVLLIIVIKSRA
ncbi:MAG: VWA domain-containing protein [Deltaproteobacteria bacterium]|nr:VWA domain-containing protein [Deltaproteobacteria bacterium]